MTMLFMFLRVANQSAGGIPDLHTKLLDSLRLELTVNDNDEDLEITPNLHSRNIFTKSFHARL